MVMQAMRQQHHTMGQGIQEHMNRFSPSVTSTPLAKGTDEDQLGSGMQGGLNFL